SKVQLRNQNLVELCEHLAQVLGKGIQVANVCVRDCVAFGARLTYGFSDCAVSGAPAEDQELSGVSAFFDLLQWDVIRHLEDLVAPHMRHLLVILRIVGDVTAVEVLLEPANAVTESGSAWYRPGTGEVFVAQE